MSPSLQIFGLITFDHGHRWADRDMVYRYCGLGIGHIATWDATRVFREDLWKAFKLPKELLDPLDLADMDLGYVSDESGSECDSVLTARRDSDSEGTDEEPGSDIDDEAWETDSDECDVDYDDEEGELDARCDEDDNEDDEGVGNDVESLGYSAL